VSGPLKVFAGHIDFCQVLTSCWQLCRSPWPWRSLYWTHRAPQGLSNPKHWRAEYFLLKWDNHVEWGCLPSQLYFPCRWNISVLFNPIRFFLWFGYWTYPIQREVKSQSPWVLDHSCRERQSIWFVIWSVRQCKQGRPPKLALSDAEQTKSLDLDLPLCWNHFGKQRPRIHPFMQHVCQFMPGRPPMLVLTGNFLPHSSIPKSWRNLNSSTMTRKYN